MEVIAVMALQPEIKQNMCELPAISHAGLVKRKFKYSPPGGKLTLGARDC